MDITITAEMIRNKEVETLNGDLTLNSKLRLVKEAARKDGCVVEFSPASGSTIVAKLLKGAKQTIADSTIVSIPSEKYGDLKAMLIAFSRLGYTVKMDTEAVKAASEVILPDGADSKPMTAKQKERLNRDLRTHDVVRVTQLLASKGIKSDADLQTLTMAAASELIAELAKL